MTKRKISAFWILICILFSFQTVLAEDPGTLLSDLDLQYQEQLFEQTRPLLELSVAASMHSGETAFEFDPGDDMPESFAAALDHFSGLYGFNETSQMHEWLQSNYALSVPQNITEKSFPEVSYTGLFLLELTPSPDHSQFAVTAEIYMAPKPYEALTDADWDHFVWADMMATITLQHDDSASLGWKVTSLHYSTAYFSDDTDEPQMSDVPLLENYYSEKYGCSIAYPAVFDEEDMISDDEGVQCKLADGSASLEIRFEPSSETSAEAALHSVLAAHPEVTMLSTEFSNVICLEYEDSEMRTRWFCMQENQTMITVSLSWKPDIHEDFSDLADEIMQSLISEENTQG